MNNQQVLKFGQNLLLLGLFSLIFLGIMGGLYFEGTALEAVLYATISVAAGSLAVWASTKSFLKVFNIWDWKQNTLCAIILFIIFTVLMISSSGV